MKKLLFLSSIISLFIISSCSNDDKDNTPTDQQIRLSKEIYNETDYGITTYLYLYDTQNKLRKIASDDGSEEFTYNDDGTLNKLVTQESIDTESEIFHYKNGKIDFIIKSGFQGAGENDTIFFFYGNNGMPYRTINSYYGENGVNSTIIEYTFDNNKKLISRFERIIFDGELGRYDSTYYTWTKGNLTRIDTKMWYEGLLNYTNKIEFEYDNKLNYYWTSKYPQEYILYQSLTPDDYFSANNRIVKTTSMTSGSTHTYIRNISDYNDEGYPLMINGEWGTWELQYETY